jgi:hypothetical protein
VAETRLDQEQSKTVGPDPSRDGRRIAVGLGAAGLVVAVTALPVANAYLGVRQVVGERGRQEALDNSATWRSYLSPAETSVLYGPMHARFQRSENQLFTGFVVVGLAVACLLLPRRPGASKSWWADPVPIAYGLGALLAVDVSLGSNGLTYRALYDYVLPFRALRIPARMGLIAGFSVAVLGGCGAARLASRLQSSSAQRTLFVALASLMVAEYASKPVQIHTVQRQPPQVYADIIRDRGDAPTAAIFDFPASALDDPTYMYYSTFHWQHVVNGYSGFFPPWYSRFIETTNQLPSDAAFNAIRQHGTRYLVVHGERLYGNRYPTLIEDLDKRSDLVLVSRHAWYDNRKHSEISAYRILY